MIYKNDRFNELYAQAKFLTIYNETSELWTPKTALRLSPAELYNASRLASRLGCNRTKLWLDFKLWEHDPQGVFSKLTNGFCHPLKYSPIQDLKGFESNRFLETGDRKLDASWLVNYALKWLPYRNFKQAETLLKQAAEVHKDYWWSFGKLQLLEATDKREEALQIAEMLFKNQCYHPAVFGSYTKLMHSQGRSEECLEQLDEVLKTTESYEIALSSAQLINAVAERANPKRRHELLQRSKQVSTQAFNYQPLEDRYASQVKSHLTFNTALIENNSSVIAEFAEKPLYAPFAGALTENYRDRGQGAYVLFKHKAEVQDHVTCLPTSISVVAGALNASFNSHEMVQEITYDGTSLTTSRDWLRQRGFQAELFNVTPENCRKLLNEKLPFVLSRTSYNSAHATACVGWLSGADCLIIHDPSYSRLQFQLIEKLGHTEAPIGPTGLVFSKTHDLSKIFSSEELFWGAANEAFSLTLYRYGLEEAETILAQQKTYDEAHPAYKRNEALLLSSKGELDAALSLLNQLHQRYPDNLYLKKDLIITLQKKRDYSAVIDMLKAIILNKKFSRFSSSDGNRKEDMTYWTTMYADLLSFSGISFDEAEAQLKKCLKVSPFDANVLHVYGDFLRKKDKDEEALFYLLTAAMMDPFNEHYARSTADTYRWLGQTAEGIEFLKERVKELGDKVEGWQAYTTLIDCLDDYGYPVESAVGLAKLTKQFPSSPEALVYALNKATELGLPVLAEQSYQQLLKSSGSGLIKSQAEYSYSLWKGHKVEMQAALQQWRQLQPHNIDVLKKEVWLIRNYEGLAKAVERVKQVYTKYPDDFELFDYYADLLNEMERDDTYEQVINSYLKSHPNHLSCLFRLVRLKLNKLELCEQTQQQSVMEQEVLPLADLFKEYSEEGADLFFMQYRIELAQKNYRNAADYLLSMLNINPCSSIIYEFIWQLLPHLQDSEQKEFIEVMENYISLNTVNMEVIPAYINCFASHYGFQQAKEKVTAFHNNLPGSTAVYKGVIELYLNHTAGVEHIIEVLPTIEEAVHNYPGHADFLYSYANALIRMERFSQAQEVYLQLTEKWPTSITAWTALSQLQCRENQYSEALAYAERALMLSPTDYRAIFCKSEVLCSMMRNEDNLSHLLEAIKLIPENVNLYEHAISTAIELEKKQTALDIAKCCIDFFPQGAYSHFLMGKVLYHTRHNSLIETECALKKSLSLNPALFEAAELLSSIYSECGEYDKARGVINELQRHSSNQHTILGQMACIEYDAGHIEKGIEILAEAIELEPNYSWAWETMILWIKEIRNWRLAEKYLLNTGESLAMQPRVAARRIDLLECAEIKSVDFYTEWQQLSSNHPSDELVQLKAFDFFHANKHLSELGQIVHYGLTYFPDSKFFQARRVKFLLTEHKVNDAIQCFEQLSKRKGDLNWEVGECFQESSRTGHAVELVNFFSQQINRGETYNPCLYMTLVEYAELSVFWKGGKKKKSKSRRLKVLMELLKSAGTADPSFTAAIVEEVVELGKGEKLLNFWRNHQQLFKANRYIYRSGVRVLSCVIGENIAIRKHAALFLSSWHSYSINEAFVPSIYIWLLINKAHDNADHMEALYENSRLALDLPKDYSYFRILQAQAYACLCLGKVTDFLQLLDYHSIGFYGQIDPDAPGLSKNNIKMNEYFCLFHKLCSAQSTETLPTLQRAFKTLYKSYPYPYMKIVWKHYISEKKVKENPSLFTAPSLHRKPATSSAQGSENKWLWFLVIFFLLKFLAKLAK